MELLAKSLKLLHDTHISELQVQTAAEAAVACMHTNTILCQINMPGAEADNEALILSDSNEFHNLDPYTLWLYALKVA